METRVYECESKDRGAFQKVLETEPYAHVSFARQGYKLKEGKMVGGEEGKYYLYIKGELDFFKWGEDQVKAANIASFARAKKEIEEKVI
ncbi:MAG: hypothetical protein ABIF01_00440, partial [Candidatus Micrarchaeota archaeon]